MELRRTEHNLSFAVKDDTTVALKMFGVFLLCNSIKISFFNYMITYSKGLSAVLYKNFYTLLLTIIVYSILSRIKYRLPLLIIYITQAIYLFAYLSYFSYFHGYLHLFQASALMTESTGPIMHLSIPISLNMLIILLDLPAFIYFIVKYKQVYKAVNNRKLVRQRLLLGSISVIIVLEMAAFFRGNSIIQLGEKFYTSEPMIVQRYGTIMNNVSDVLFNYGGHSMVKAFKYGKVITPEKVTTNKPNIVIIQVESMDANVINKQYNGKFIAPFLHKLSTQSIYYPYTMSYHKAGGTSDCEFSILNSIEPLSDFPSIKLSSYTYPNSVVKVLKKGGYKAFAFHGNVGAFYSRDSAFKKMGFDQFYDIKKMGLKDIGWGAPDGDVMNYALNKLVTVKQPFFSYLITISSHMPFESVDSFYHNTNYDSVANSKVKHYMNSISYVDKSIGSFVESIQRKLPNTYIFIWGDHTPSINEDEYRQASYTIKDKYFEFVPLILVTPDKIKYKSTTKAASFLDIAPTVLNASGINFRYRSDGADLLDKNAKMGVIPFREAFFSRTLLYKNISDKECYNKN